MTADLIESGQSYIGVTGSDLLDALRMAPPGTAPGEVFERVIRPLGGKPRMCDRTVVSLFRS